MKRTIHRHMVTKHTRPLIPLHKPTLATVTGGRLVRIMGDEPPAAPAPDDGPTMLW